MANNTQTKQPEVVQTENQRRLKSLQKGLLGTLTPTAKESQLSRQLASLQAGTELGVAGLKGQGRGIPLGLVRGQQAKLQEQAGLQQIGLQRQLGIEQQERFGRGRVAEAQLGFEEARQAPLLAEQRQIRKEERAEVSGLLGEQRAEARQVQQAQAQSEQKLALGGFRKLKPSELGQFTEDQIQRIPSLVPGAPEDIFVKPPSAEGSPFTLSPGQSRFDAQGNLVAFGGIEEPTDLERARLSLINGQITAQEIKNQKDLQALLAQDNGELTPEQAKTAQSLSGQITGGASYKDMLDIQTGMLGVLTGISQDNGFGDIAAINAFQRMVDPGATVRSEDVTLLQTASAFIAKIAPQFVIDRLKKGDKLPSSVREQMKKTALELYGTRRNNYEESISPQRNLADTQGIDFGKFVATEFKTAEELTLPKLPENIESTDFLQLKKEFPDRSDKEILDALEQSIGFNKVGSDTNKATGNRPQRNNNPGNVKIGGIADKFALKNPDGTPQVDDQNHLIFPNPNAGFNGLKADLKAKISGRSRIIKETNPTIRQLGKAFAEDPKWAGSVARLLGVDVNTKTQLIPFDKLVKAVATQEGFFA